MGRFGKKGLGGFLSKLTSDLTESVQEISESVQELAGQAVSAIEETAAAATVTGPVADEAAIEAARNAAQAQGERIFVDSAGAIFRPTAARGLPGSRVIVDVAVEPASLVGYAALKFLSHSAGGTVTELAVYAPESARNDLFTLLSTPQGAPLATIPKVAP